MKNLKHFLTQLLPFTGSVLVQGRTLQREKESGQSSVILIIIILVIVMAVMFAGGGTSLFSGNIASPITGTPVPAGGNGTTTPSTSPSGSLSPSPTGQVWSIKDTPGECTTQNGQTLRKDTITATGPSGGYIELDLKNSDNSYTVIETHAFTPPILGYGSTISSTSVINKSPWRINIYQGGNINNNVWSNGILKASEDENPTGC